MSEISHTECYIENSNATVLRFTVTVYVTDSVWRASWRL